MEKVEAYKRSKDYSHIRDRYKFSSYKYKNKKNETFITLEEKIGLQLVLCAIILTTLVAGKLFGISNITKFENTIAKLLNDDSTRYIEGTIFESVFNDFQTTLNEEIGLNTEESTPVINIQNDDVIEEQYNLENYEDTIFEKK